MLFYVNYNYSMTIIGLNEKNYVYINSDKHYIILNIDIKNTFLNKNNSLIEWKNESLTFSDYKKVFSIINNFIFLWNFLFFKKINYKGKSFKFKKKKKFINFILNTSHLTWTLSITHIVKRIRKNKLLYFYSNESVFNQFILKLLSYRGVDIFTKRGFRLSRCILYKKKGKTNMKI
jgi:hypothetical protein